jgi:hypothetical protein
MTAATQTATPLQIASPDGAVRVTDGHWLLLTEAGMGRT